MARQKKHNVTRVFVPITNASGLGTALVDGRVNFAYPNSSGEVIGFGFVTAVAGVGTALVTISVEKDAGAAPGILISNTQVLDLDAAAGTRLDGGLGNGVRFDDTDRLALFFDFDGGTATTQAFILAYVDLVL
jgi:hypothetical protein